MSGRTTILALCLKDWRLTLRDRAALALGIALPVVLVVGFGFVYEMVFGGEGGLQRTTIAVLDADRSEASRAFRTRLGDTETVDVEAEEVEDEEEALARARRLVAEGEEHHVLVLGRGFGRALAEGRIPPMRLVRDPGRTLESQLVAVGVMQAFLSRGSDALSAEWTVRALREAGLPDPLIERARSLAEGFRLGVRALFEQAEREAPGEEAADRDAEAARDEGAKEGFDFGRTALRVLGVESEDVVPPGRPRQLTFWLAHNVAGLSTMMLMFGLVGAASVLLLEAQSGTLARLLLAPLPRSNILWAKFLYTASFGLVQLAVVYGIAEAVFRVGLFRAPLELLAVSLALVFCVTSLGLLLATLARTQKQAEGLATVLILIMSAVGGAWFPIQMVDLPPVGAVVVRATVTWWAVEAYHRILWYGRDLADPTLQLDLAVLLAVGTVALLASRFAFRSRFLSA